MAALEALNFNVQTFFLQIVNLFIIMGILYILLFKPVSKALEDRQISITSSLDKAAQDRESAQKLLAEYQEQLQASKVEAQEIINRAKKISEEMKNEVLDKAREEATKHLEKAKAEIANEQAKALTAIREEATTLALLAAGKVLGKTITGADQEKMVKDFIAQVGKLQ